MCCYKVLTRLYFRTHQVIKQLGGGSRIENAGSISTGNNTALQFVGAGDSVTAGFLAGLLDTEDYALALRLGTACGSATAYSAGLASRDMIEAVLPAVEITTL